MVGVSGRACEGGCSLQGPGTPAWGDRGCCPGGGRCVVKGLRGGLQPSNPGHTSLGGQGVPPRRWSVCPEGSVRGAAVSKARGHHPGGTAVLDQAMVGAPGRACEEGCRLQGRGTPAWWDKGFCPGGGRCVLNDLRGGRSLQGPETPAWGDRGSCAGGCLCFVKGLRGGLQPSKPGHTSAGRRGVLPWQWSVRPEGLARGAAVSKAQAHQHGGTGGPARAVVGAS